MKSISISKADLKRFLIEYQGLGNITRFKGKEGVKEYFKRVGCVQFDPLNVVGRNADLTLQSRIAGYKPSMLEALLYEDRVLVDGWDKQMSIYNVEDWCKMKKVREAASVSLVNTLKKRKSHKALNYIDDVKAQLKEIGATKPGAIDVGDVERGSWGHGRISSVVMDYLFHSGEVGIKTKAGTQKVYDFIENLLDPVYLNMETHFKCEEDFFDWYVKRRIGSIGLYWNRNGDGWLGQYISKKEYRQPAIERLVSKEDICPVDVEGFKETFYIRREDVSGLENTRKESEASMAIKSPIVRFIAPLDNFIWDRKLIKQAFDFSYSWEVYKPAAKREYGYYVLPVLYGDQFIGRFEPEHVKGGNKLSIKHWWWEDGVEVTPEMIEAVKEAFEKFKVYLSVDAIENDLDGLLA